MRKQYLHLSAYSCDGCQGPVVSASLAVRENAISKETDVQASGSNLPVVRPSAAERDGDSNCPSYFADGMGT